MAKDNELVCSFCGKTSSEVRKIIVGPDVFICNECIDLCQSLIEEEAGPIRKKSFSKLPKPYEIKEELDDYVIEQEEAKKKSCCSSLQSLQEN